MRRDIRRDDHVQDQLCARIDDLEREKEILASMLDKAEQDVLRLFNDNRDLRREVVSYRGG